MLVGNIKSSLDFCSFPKRFHSAETAYGLSVPEKVLDLALGNYE